MSSDQIIRKKGRPPKLSQQKCLEICQKVKEGVRRKEISTEYGVSRKTILAITKNFQLMERQEIYPEDEKIYISTNFPSLDKQLHDWCLEQETKGIILTWDLLSTAGSEIMKNTKRPKNFLRWMRTFAKHYNIPIKIPGKTPIRKLKTNFLKYPLRKRKEVDEQLFNWLLDRIILRDIISNKLNSLLNDKTKELLSKYGESLNNVPRWRKEFKKCHEILINFVTLQNFEGGDETKSIESCEQYTNLEKQLFNWLIEQKKLGCTISHTMLRNETLKLIIDDFERSNEVGEENWLWKIGQRYFLPKSYTFEMFQRQIQTIKKIYEREQSELKKIIYKLNQRIEEENINKNNIYIMIQTDVIWRTHVQILLEFAERKEIKEEIAKKKINVEKLKNSVTTMFCINVTGSHKLSPITGELTYDDQTLEGDVATKESKEFAFWYNNLFKESVREHQLEKNITGKVLLLVENYTQHILLENIIQDDDFEILILPINTVSFFKPLYPELINEINRIFENDMLKRIDKLTNLYKESLVKEFNRSYNINFHETTICKSWLLVKIENTEELWRKIFEQCRQKDTVILSTVQLVNYLTKVYN